MNVIKDVIKVEFTTGEEFTFEEAYHKLRQLVAEMREEKRTVLHDYYNDIVVKIDDLENVITILYGLAGSNDIRIENPNGNPFYYQVDINKENK